MKTSFRFRYSDVVRRLSAVILFSAAFVVSVAGVHAEPLVTAEWLNGHRTETALIVLDIRSAIDGGGAQAYAALADLLHQLVGTNCGTGPFRDRRLIDRGPQTGSGVFEETVRRFVGL